VPSERDTAFPLRRVGIWDAQGASRLGDWCGASTSPRRGRPARNTQVGEGCVLRCGGKNIERL